MYKSEIFNEPRVEHVNGYGFLSFAKNMSKSLSNKYGQKLLDGAKKCATDAIKTIQKTAEVTDDLIGNKTANKITGVSKKSPKELQNDKMEAPKKDTYLQKKDNKLLMN